MAEQSLLNSGIKKKFSKRFNREFWGFDIRFNGARIRNFSFENPEDASKSLEAYRQAKLSNRIRTISKKHSMEPHETVKAPISKVSQTCKKGSIGSCAELTVTVDLLRRGFDVYNAASQNSACDLVAIKHGKIARIEVKSATWKRGSSRFHRGELRQENFDILALVFLRENEIRYQPSIETIFKSLA